MSETAIPAAAIPRRRWLWGALIASLAINALLVGMVMRTLWQVRAHVVMAGGGVEASLPAFVNTLPAERRDALSKAALPERPGMLRPLRMELRQARMEAARIFRADPFDKAAFVAAQGRLFEAETRLRQAVQQMMPEIGERMTAGERRAYLQWRGRGFGGGFRRGEGGARNGLDEPGPGSRRP